MQAQLYFIHALSPLHAGTGQGVGVIDLPIAREKATNIPYLPGSSVKGVLRDRSRDVANGKTAAVFGPETADIDANAYAGAIRLSDAKLLLLPVRSLFGTFAWVTSPYLLQCFVRDALMVGVELPMVPPLPNPLATNVPEQMCLVTPKSVLKPGAANQAGQVYLEDLDLHGSPDADLENWAAELAKRLFIGASDANWRNFLKQRLCLVHDDVLGFLLETATEVVARIRMEEERKVVAEGALWYEEYLPTETILTGLVGAQSVTYQGATTQRTDVEALIKQLASAPLQFGGKATVGRGVCRMVV